MSHNYLFIQFMADCETKLGMLNARYVAVQRNICNILHGLREAPPKKKVPPILALPNWPIKLNPKIPGNK